MSIELFENDRDAKWMRQALEAAQGALALGEVPIGRASSTATTNC
ncbi:MAG: hypothetical protein WKF84_25770 [Pyrinomonadaceae bacterium]